MRYNSVVLVSPTGEVLVNYRKSFLYYTDETWAEEGKQGFFAGTLPRLGQVAMGICMLFRWLSHAADVMEADTGSRHGSQPIPLRGALEGIRVYDSRHAKFQQRHPHDDGLVDGRIGIAAT